MKRTVTVLLSAAMLAAWAVPASAHVTAEDPSVPKDSDAELTFSVPVEEGGHKDVHAMHGGPEKKYDAEPGRAYNKEVSIEVPRGFEVLSCDQTADWKCEAEPAEGSDASGVAPGGTITFTRVPKSGGDMDHLSFTVHTPRQVGRYSFPTTVWTSDGEATEWRGDGVTSENPSPIVQVVDEDGGQSPEGGHDHK